MIYRFCLMITGVVSLLHFFPAPAIGQGIVNFFAPMAYDGGVGFATGDLNNDGKADIISAKADRISVRLGTGTGKFPQNASPVYTCSNFTSTAISKPFVSDFNGDGKADVAAWIDDSGCRGSRAVVVVPGDGNGGFAPPIFTEISNFVFTPNQFASADFNGDGRPDLAVAVAFSGTFDRVGILLNNGNGTFAAPVEYNLTGSQSGFNLIVGDYNNDNRPDLFYGSRSPENVMVLTNSGTGTFSAPITAIVGTSNIVAVGNFDGDSNLDLITVQTNTTNPTLRSWIGNGNGNFTGTLPLSLSIANSGLGKALPADYNNDGKLDLALQADNRTVVVNGDGSGGFVEDEIYAVGGGGNLFKADFDNDGLIDLGVTQALGLQGSPFGASGEFAILKNFANGKFIVAPEFEIGFGGDESLLADLNGDGLKDIVITGDASNGEILVLLQNSGVAFSDSGSKRKIGYLGISAGVSSVSPRTLAAADFNGDGKIDIVTAGRRANGGTQNVLVLRNDGAGNLSLFTSMSLPGEVKKVVVGNFNSDNFLDLAFAETVDTTSPISAVYVALGNGDGTFSSPVGYLNNFAATSIATSDLNGDQRGDLAVALTNRSVAVLMNGGNGEFGAGAVFDLNASVTDIRAADMQGDGKADLIVSSNLSFISNTAKISIISGNGDGTFAAPVNYPTVSLYDQKLAIEDFNGDGKPDVAASHNGVISVLLNNGLGVLTGKSLWASAGALKSITAGDLDGDGKIDLLTTSAYNSFYCLNILLNIPAPSTAPKAFFDFDGDAKTDLSIFRPGVGEWWLSRSSDGGSRVYQFGGSTDKIAPADYTGDGKTDVAFWRPSTGEWYVLRSEDSSFFAFPFGANGDVPVPADYDGDGKADAAVFRESNLTWYINKSSGGTQIVGFGAAGDLAVPADYDGDGKTDIAIFRPNAVGGAQWWILRSSTGTAIALQFGSSTDKTVPGDYTGDGKADVAIWRPSTGVWSILRSEDFSFYAFPFGAVGDLPSPGDYDGDGKFDATVFRPSNSTWFANRSTAGVLIQQFGTTGDLPLPNAFVK